MSEQATFSHRDSGSNLKAYLYIRVHELYMSTIGLSYKHFPNSILLETCHQAGGAATADTHTGTPYAVGSAGDATTKDVTGAVLESSPELDIDTAFLNRLARDRGLPSSGQGANHILNNHNQRNPQKDLEYVINGDLGWGVHAMMASYGGAQENGAEGSKHKALKVRAAHSSFAAARSGCPWDSVGLSIYR